MRWLRKFLRHPSARSLAAESSNANSFRLELLESRVVPSATVLSNAVTTLGILASSTETTTNFNLNQTFDDPSVVGTVVQFAVHIGSANTQYIDVELFDHGNGTDTYIPTATITNFLNNYVANTQNSAQSYTNTIFHRSVANFVIQGGGFSTSDLADHISTSSPVALEYHYANSEGTIAMARTGDPNSATSEFFINTVDNSTGLGPGGGDSYGYTVFGKVIAGTMSTVDAIASLNTYNVYQNTNQAVNSALTNVPLTGYSSGTPTTANYVYVSQAKVVPELTYTILSNSNDDIGSATIDSTTGQSFAFKANPNAYGSTILTIRATDLDGTYVDRQIEVTVGDKPTFNGLEELQAAAVENTPYTITYEQLHNQANITSLINNPGFRIESVNSGTLLLDGLVVTPFSDAQNEANSAILKPGQTLTWIPPSNSTPLNSTISPFVVRADINGLISDSTYSVTFDINGPGNTMSAAQSINTNGSFNGTQQFHDYIGTTDYNDYYKFHLSDSSVVSLSLAGLSANANLELIRDNGHAAPDQSNIIALSAKAGAANESIIASLSEGDYYVRVFPSTSTSSNTYYDLTIHAATDGAGDTTADASDLGTLSSAHSIQGSVGTTDTADFYQFHVSSPSEVGLHLSGLGANANLTLMDSAGHTIAASSALKTATDNIAWTLASGDYYVRVNAVGSAKTFYDLTVDAPVADDAGQTSSQWEFNAAAGKQTFHEFVGTSDARDVYHLHLTGTDPTYVNASLSGLSADANLALYQDSNHNGIFDAADTLVAKSAKAGKAADNIALALASGDYFAVVTPGAKANTAYDLSLETPATTVPSADLGTLTGPYTHHDFLGQISPTGTNLTDTYSFTLDEASLFTAQLTGLRADANLQLVHKVSGGADEVISVSKHSGAANENISLALAAGDYELSVAAATSAVNTYYDLSMKAAADGAGSTIDEAHEINSSSFLQAGSVSSNNALDLYKFHVDASSHVNLQLSGLSANANLTLMQDLNGDGILNASTETITTSAKLRTANEVIDRSLDPGDYYIGVSSVAKANTFYNLALDVTANAHDESLDTATDLGALGQSQSVTGWVGAGDTVDLYKFSVGARSQVNVLLTGLSADAQIQVLADSNGNGNLSDLKVVATSANHGTLSERINAILASASGTYYIRVYTGSSTASAPYTLSIDSQLVTAV